MPKRTYRSDMEDHLMFAQVKRVSNGSGVTFTKAKSEILEACQQEIEDLKHTMRRIRDLKAADVEDWDEDDDGTEE